MQRASAVERIPRPRTSTTVALRPAPVARSTVTVKCCFMAARSLSMASKCPYRTLGVAYDADEEAIRVAYRRKAKQMHPDVSGSASTAIAFMECQSAYQTLLDPEKRAKYDKTLLPRANSQVLSYLNARSAARHGVPISRVPSRATYHDRPELYSTMLELLDQVKSCAKHLEREIVSKDGVWGGLGPMPASSTSSRPCTPVPRSNGVVASESDCGDAECCEPWLYYAAQPVAEEATPAATVRRRR